MPSGCSTLGRHQEVVPVYFIKVRTFNPDGLVLRTSSLVHQNLARPHRLVRIHIKFLHTDGTMSAVFRLVVRRVIIIDKVGLPIFIEKERGINACHFGQHNRIRPFAKRILCLHKEVSNPYIGSNHIISLVMRVVGYGRGKNPSTYVLPLHVD